MKKIISLLLAVAMLISIQVVSLAENDTLVIASDAMSEKFSPFFAESQYDRDACDWTQVGLMTTDRMGGIVFNGIEGETIPYNGVDYFYHGPADLSVKYDEASDTTKYTAKIKKGILFSDGKEATADDLIFTYYVLLDPDYEGSTTLYSYPIVGLQDYRTQTSSEVYTKYDEIIKSIKEKGEEYKVTADDGFAQELVDDYWKKIEEAWTAGAQEVVETVNSKYPEDAAKLIGVEQVSEDQKVFVTAPMWNLGTYDAESGVLTMAGTKAEFKKDGIMPTIEDLVANVKAMYENNLGAFTEAEIGKNLEEKLNGEFISYWGPKDEEMAGKGVKSIAGIKKLDDYTVEITLEGFSAPAVYQVLGAYITPMHYYGDPDQYKPEEGLYGHPFGDLSLIRSKTTKPMGAGPYKFIEYKNKVVYYEANENYYKGEPKIKYLQIKETQTSELVAGVLSGSVDTGNLSGSKRNFEQVRGENSNGELSGDKITTTLVDNLGYGYIGLNAETINVGGKENKGSDESKALRRGLATVLAAFRDISYESYYGDAAAVIEYPISATSWAAPQKTDADYRTAFSVDAEGNDLYTADMTHEQKIAAALEGAKSWFKAAGYTYDEASGMFTAAPEGARMSYEIIIPAGGTGDHPNYTVLTSAKEELAKIGIELKINDPADGNILWDALNAGTQDLWTAAWQTTIDPDMYQIYHSSSIAGRGGSGSNHYRIEDPELDNLIVDARKSDDQQYRKEIYKQALDLIVDWAVEIPAYQRKNSNIFSTERINVDTLAKDVTTFYNWGAEIETLEMR